MNGATSPIREGLGNAATATRSAFTFPMTRIFPLLATRSRSRQLILFAFSISLDVLRRIFKLSVCAKFGESHMHISSNQFSAFAKNRFHSSARLGRKTFTGLALALTVCLLASGGASAGPSRTPPTLTTVSLPTATFDISVPIDTVIIEPMVTTYIGPSLNYIGFQGDFTFDERVVSFTSPFVQAAGLTATGWTVAANILPGAGPIRTLRVLGYVNDGLTPLNGSGILYELRMLRVSSTPNASAPLTWAAPPDNFLFIDFDLNTVTPAQNNGIITIVGPGPRATPTATARVHPVDTVPPDPGWER